MISTDRVRNLEEAFVYVADCNLATVCDLSMKKSRAKYEYERQIAIAQLMINWIKEFGLDCKNTRAEAIVNENISVKEYARRFDAASRGE